MVQGIGVLDIGRLTNSAHGQVQLVVSGHVLKEVPGPLETELWHPVQQQIGFECTTYAVSVFDVRARPTGMNLVGSVDSQQEACAKERDQRRRL